MQTAGLAPEFLIQVIRVGQGVHICNKFPGDADAGGSGPGRGHSCENRRPLTPREDRDSGFAERGNH